eukprot:scaffold8212_cov93-Cylindrotheca_fusiformis.AAC.12
MRTRTVQRTLALSAFIFPLAHNVCHAFMTRSFYAVDLHLLSGDFQQRGGLIVVTRQRQNVVVRYAGETSDFDQDDDERKLTSNLYLESLSDNEKRMDDDEEADVSDSSDIISRQTETISSDSSYPSDMAISNDDDDQGSSSRRNNMDLGSIARSARSSVAAVARSGSGHWKATSKRAKDFAVQGTTSAFGLAEKGVSGLQFVAREGTTRVGEIAVQGTTNAFGLAEKGVSGLQYVAREGTTRVGEIAVQGTTNAFGLAEKGVSGLQFFTREGTTRVGEMAQWIDSQAKMGTQQVGSKAKSLIQNFTGKDDYQFGDVTRELLRRIASQEVSMSDTILLLKILLAVGASFAPLAKALPFTVLLEALNVSLEQKIGGKVLEALAVSLDDRISAAFTSDDKFQLGDAVKRSLLAGILAFTGKESYKSGDIQREVIAKQEKEEEKEEIPTKKPPADQHLDIPVGPELEEWDRAFRESCGEQEELGVLFSSDENGGPIDENAAKEMDMKIARELEELNAMFKKKYADYGL